MRIAFVISSLSPGGSERVISVLSELRHKAGDEVTLITFEPDSTSGFYPVAKGIRHIPLGSGTAASSIFQRIGNLAKRFFRLRSALRTSEPDVVISFIDVMNIFTILASPGLRIPVVVCERTDPLQHEIGAFKRYLRRITYPRAAKVVVQTQHVCNTLDSLYSWDLCTIPNPVIRPPDCYSRPHKPPHRPCIVGMGRMIPSKRFDILLQAFADLRIEFPEWSLVLVGEGPELPKLKQHAESLSIDDHVLFTGKVRNVYEYLRNADIFAFPSEYEGFPNALCEAMSVGLPVVSMDCPSGPAEIVRHETDGLLVPNKDTHAFTSTLRRLMADEQERKRMGKNAVEITERFSIERIMKLWDECLNDATVKPKRR